MRKSWSTVAGAARRCAVFIVLPAVAACTAGPAPVPERDGAAREVPRSPYGDGSPDLNGIWQALGSAHWDIEPHVATPGPVLEIGAVGAAPAGLGVVEGGAIPYQEWALERRAENAANRPGGDPEVQCVLPGVPRAMYLPLPFQIIQTPERIMMAFEYANAVRTIHMGEPYEGPIDTWLGTSNGRWDGDTLVIETTGFNIESVFGTAGWLDRAGNFHGAGLSVVERLTPLSADHLLYEATLEDPDVYTRPWTIRMPLYRRIEEGAQILEFKCVEFVEELLFGHLGKPGSR